jgi:cardiolipin synthase
VADVYKNSLFADCNERTCWFVAYFLQATIFAIANAKSLSIFKHPIFLPTEGLNQTLQTAALAGVDVRLMYGAVRIPVW